MTRLLIACGVILGLLGVAAFAVPHDHEGPEHVIAEGDADSAGRGSHVHHDGPAPGSADKAGKNILSVGAPTRDREKLKGELYPSLADRGKQPLARTGSGMAGAVPLHAAPTVGRGELYMKNTVGGLNEKRHVIVDWEIVSPQEVRLRGVNVLSGMGHVTAALRKGVWHCDVPQLEARIKGALLDIARVVVAGKSGFGAKSTYKVGDRIPIAGESFSFWADDGAHSLFVAPTETGEAPDEYPRIAGCWNEFRISRDENGRWLHAERLQVKASSASEPGSFIKRVRLEFRPSRPAAPASEERD